MKIKVRIIVWIVFCLIGEGFIFSLTVSAQDALIGNPLRLSATYRLYDYSVSSWRTDTNFNIGTLKDGQIAYFVCTNGTCPTIAPVSKIYRYYNSGAKVLKDEVADPGTGWIPQLYLGEVYNQLQSGTVAVQLHTNSAGKCVTLLEGDSKSGYTLFKTLGYAYPRYGTNGISFYTLSKGGVDWKFNKASGGSLWHVVYDDFQFINNHDFGRQIQCGAQWDLKVGYNETNRFAVAESGMGSVIYGAVFSNALTRMGSPLQYCYTNSLGILLTKTSPLENWESNCIGEYGGSGLEPVLYQDLYFRKEISVGILGRDRVMCWKQVFSVPDSFTVNNPNLTWMHNGIAATCLKATVTNLWVYNAADGSLTNKTERWWNGGTNTQFADYHITGKCIIMGSDTNHCFGMMAKDTEDGGSVEYWMGYYWKTLGDLTNNGEFGNNTVTMIGYNSEPWRSGENNYYAYLIVGTLSSVTNDAQKLYDDQNLIPWAQDVFSDDFNRADVAATSTGSAIGSDFVITATKGVGMFKISSSKLGLGGGTGENVVLSYLGFGIENSRPGEWVTVQADITPGVINSGILPGLAFNYKNATNFYLVRLSTGVFAGAGTLQFIQYVDGVGTSFATGLSGLNIQSGVTYTLTVSSDTAGEFVYSLVGGTLSVGGTVTDPTIDFTDGYVGIYQNNGNTNTVFDNFSVIQTK